MLKNHRHSQLVRNLHLLLDNSPLFELLRALALEWGYQLTDDTAEQPLLLISESLPRPMGFRHALAFSSSHYRNRPRLEIPLTIETLYLALENHFLRTPRNHIRINAERPLQVRVRNQQFKSHSVTVSDRGLRFISPLELEHHEELEIHLELEDGIYDLPAQVVYSIVGKEVGRGDRIEVGVVCTPLSKTIRESLRSWIISSYLKRVRPVLGSNLFAEALKQLNLTSISKVTELSEAKG
jgi:hypothetical protein